MPSDRYEFETLCPQCAEPPSDPAFIRCRECNGDGYIAADTGFGGGCFLCRGEGRHECDHEAHE